MKVGDYVRTKYGIAKYISDRVTKQTIYKIIDKPIIYDNIEGWENCLCDNEIIKSSPNIIDLIEVGDYVNGHKVIDFMLENGKRKGIIVDADIWGFDIDEIKSIVTKQQFSHMEYKAGE